MQLDYSQKVLLVSTSQRSLLFHTEEKSVKQVGTQPRRRYAALVSRRVVTEGLWVSLGFWFATCKSMAALKCGVPGGSRDASSQCQKEEELVCLSVRPCWSENPPRWSALCPLLCGHRPPLPWLQVGDRELSPSQPVLAEHLCPMPCALSAPCRPWQTRQM